MLWTDLANAEALALALRTLPPSLQDICRRLTTSSMTSVARDLGVTRRTLYTALEEIRQHLHHAGLGER